MATKKKEEQKENMIDIGVKIKQPEKECDDHRCAWHGTTSVRGRIFYGTVRSSKPSMTVVVEWPYHRFLKKFDRYERRTSRVNAHNPRCIKAKEGDRVVIGECRPISKTKKFVVLGFEKDIMK